VDKFLDFCTRVRFPLGAFRLEGVSLDFSMLVEESNGSFYG
jgi:hypothetical protein